MTTPVYDYNYAEESEGKARYYLFVIFVIKFGAIAE